MSWVIEWAIISGAKNREGILFGYGKSRLEEFVRRTSISAIQMEIREKRRY